MPETPEQFDDLVRERIERAMDALIEIHTIALKPPPGLSEEYVESLRMSVFNMFETAHPVWEATYPKSEDVPGGGGTLAGFLLRLQREGKSLKDMRFEVKMPPKE